MKILGYEIEKEFVFELIKLFKPKSYNKLAGCVVGSGLFLMSTPFWQEVVTAYIKKEFGLDLNVGGSFTWGFSLVALGLLYHFLTHGLLVFVDFFGRQKKRDLQRGHDTEIFKTSCEKSNNIDLLCFYDALLAQNAYFYDAASPIYDLIEYLGHPNNSYLNNELKVKAGALVVSINALLLFMEKEFCIYPENYPGPNWRFHLYPQGNLDLSVAVTDEADKEYDRLAAELRKLADAMKQDYLTYRAEIKEKLFI